MRTDGQMRHVVRLRSIYRNDKRAEGRLLFLRAEGSRGVRRVRHKTWSKHCAVPWLQLQASAADRQPSCVREAVFNPGVPGAAEP